MKNELRNSKGITLIALAITIVVMIILASVTIGITMSSNGIFDRTQEAKEKTGQVAEFDKGQVNEFKASMNYSEEPVTITYNYNGAYNHGTNIDGTISEFDGGSYTGGPRNQIYMNNLKAGDTIRAEFDYECTNLTANNDYFMVFQNSGGVNFWNHQIGIRERFNPTGTKSLTHFIAWDTTLTQEDIDENLYNCSIRADYYTGGSITFSNFTVRKINETTQQKQSGEKFGSLPTVTPEDGYTFVGWYTAPTNGVKITEDSRVPTTNTTYYAHWSK